MRRWQPGPSSGASSVSAAMLLPGGTAWTPATGEVAVLWVGVVGDRNPHRTAHARTAAVKALGELAD